MCVSSFQTIGKITISCRLTSFDYRNKKIFSRKNSEEKLAFTGATSQITEGRYGSDKWHFNNNPSKFTFRCFLDKFFIVQSLLTLYRLFYVHHISIIKIVQISFSNLILILGMEIQCHLMKNVSPEQEW